MQEFQLPREFYYFVGFFIVTNLGVLIGLFRSIIQREVERALVQKEIAYIHQSIGEIKSSQENMKKDINNFFQKLRDYQT